MTLDGGILLAAGGAFAVFLLAHAAGFHLWKPEGVGNVIRVSFLLGLAADLLFFGLAAFRITGQLFSLALFGGAVSLVLYGFLFFNYMALVFGMGEVAIRVRILRELERRPDHTATEEEIYRSYNADSIVTRRLDRLVEGGHLACEGGKYRIRRRILFFYSRLLHLTKFLISI